MPRADTRLQAFPGIVSTTLDKEQHRQLRLAAADLGVTPNDLLIAALFRTIMAWVNYVKISWRTPFPPQALN